MASPSKLKSAGKTGKTALTPRSSRQLSSQAKPLEGKSFYLHLLGRNVNVKDLERRLRNLGGTVENFLSKDVTCVVTDQVEGKPQARGSTGSVQVQVQTRAQLMLQKAAKQRTTSSTDVLRNARIWQIDIKPVGRVLKWVESREGRLSRDQEKPQGKVRMLRGAFIKVEDRSRKYRPLFKEMTSWPRLNLDAPPGYSPFDAPVAMRTRSHSSPRSPRSPRPRNTAKPRGNVPAKRQSPKRGYCELCDATYESLKSHVISKLHRSSAAEAGSFAGVDRLIRKGKSLQEFVADVRSRKASSATRSSSTAPHTPKRSTRTAKEDNNSKSTSRVTPVKIVRFTENRFSVVRAKRTRNSPDSKPSSSRPSKRRRKENYSVVQSTPTTVRLRRRRRPRSTSSK